MGVTDHQVHLSRFAGGDDGAALVYGYAQRLLGEHVLAGLRRSDRDFTVQRMGQTDDDRIYRRVVQNGAVVNIDVRHVMRSRKRAHGCFIHVRRSHDPRLGNRCQPARVRLRYAACTR